MYYINKGLNNRGLFDISIIIASKGISETECRM